MYAKAARVRGRFETAKEMTFSAVSNFGFFEISKVDKVYIMKLLISELFRYVAVNPK